MRKRTYLGAAAALSLLTAVAVAGPASADTGGVLTVGSAGGTNASVGDTLSAGLATGTAATFHDANGKGVSCTSATFTASVADNPAAPGVASETISALAFSGCTSNISGVSGVKSITVDNLPYSATVDDSTGIISITGPVHATIVLNLVIGSATCKYSGPSGGVNGIVSNTDNSLNFAGQAFAKDTGSWAGCPTPENFTADFAPVVDTTAGGGAVFVN